MQSRTVMGFQYYRGFGDNLDPITSKIVRSNVMDVHKEHSPEVRRNELYVQTQHTKTRDGRAEWWVKIQQAEQDLWHVKINIQKLALHIFKDTHIFKDLLKQKSMWQKEKVGNKGKGKNRYIRVTDRQTDARCT